MPDNTLQFETRVDLAGLNQGMAQATTVVSKFGTDAKTAMAAAAAATNQLADAQKQLGAAAAQGNQQAAQVIAEYQAQVVSAQAAVAALNDVEQAETATVVRSTSARMAANAELRVFEGNMMGSTRAAGALLATIPGLGVAMQAAFPVFGAIALLEILGQMAEKVHKISDEYFNLRSMENEFFQQLQAHGAANIAQSENHLKNLREQQVIYAEMNGGKAGRSDRGAATGAQFDIVQDQGKIQAASDAMAVLKSRMGELAAAAKPAFDTYQIGLSQVQVQTIASRQAAELYKQDVEQYGTYADQLKEAQDDLATHTAAEALRNKEAGEKSGSGAGEALLRNMELALDALKTSHSVSLKEEHDFWTSMVGELQNYPQQYASVMNKIADEAQEGSRKAHEAIEKFTKSEGKGDDDNEASRSMAAFSAMLAKQGEDVTHTGERWKEYNSELAKVPQIQAQVTESMELAEVAALKAEGGITAYSAATNTGAIHAADYAAKLKDLKAQLDAVNADPALTTVQKATQSQGIQNQITQTQGQAGVTGFKDAQSQAQAFSAPFLTAFNDINQGFLGVTNKMILGTQSISRDFANMGAQLVVSVADSFEKMLAKSAQFEIQSLLAHQLTNTQKIASDTSAAAITTGISATSALTQIAHEAAVAAASTWAALSGIPVIGPVLGAAAAGAAYAGVLALAAFETGGIIPNTGIAMVHQGEAVLPKSLTNMLMNTATSSSSQSSSISQTNNYNGMSDKGFRAAMTRNSEHAVATVSRGLRRQGRA